MILRIQILLCSFVNLENFRFNRLFFREYFFPRAERLRGTSIEGRVEDVGAVEVGLGEIIEVKELR